LAASRSAVRGEPGTGSGEPGVKRGCSLAGGLPAAVCRRQGGSTSHALMPAPGDRCGTGDTIGPTIRIGMVIRISVDFKMAMKRSRIGRGRTRSDDAPREMTGHPFHIRPFSYSDFSLAHIHPSIHPSPAHSHFHAFSLTDLHVSSHDRPRIPTLHCTHLPICPLDHLASRSPPAQAAQTPPARPPAPTHPTPSARSASHPLAHSLTYSPTRPHTHSPAHPFTHSPTHPLTRSHAHPATREPAIPRSRERAPSHSLHALTLPLVINASHTLTRTESLPGPPIHPNHSPTCPHHPPSPSLSPDS
jgi:hypothetical protein